jgi:hypothetical protein
VIVQEAILLGALLKICVSASFIIERAVAGMPMAKMPMVELVFRVDNVLHTSRMPISSQVAAEIKKDWEQHILASFDGTWYHIG